MFDRRWFAPLIVAGVVFGLFGLMVLSTGMVSLIEVALVVLGIGLVFGAFVTRGKAAAPGARSWVPWAVTAVAAVSTFFLMREINIRVLDMNIGADQRLIADAQSAVAAQLRDPSSAQFRKVEVVPQSNGHSVVCGEVNGKNAYGGYEGFTRFFVDETTLVIEPNEVIFGDSVNLQANTDFLNTHTDICVRAKTAALEADLR